MGSWVNNWFSLGSWSAIDGCGGIPERGSNVVFREIVSMLHINQIFIYCFECIEIVQQNQRLL